MKKLVLSFCYFIICVSVLAQTQYDYYDDDVAHQKPLITGETLLGLIVLAAIIFVVWLVKASISSVNQSIQESKRKAESARIKESIAFRETKGSC